ncbi:FadR/GntR family transcriptional regulator [Streptococcus merionis]|uniref:GntR family transcriptional regulator n=1 Tax=Streptococcus merionis TaxID=400065 RepID=A0A239SN11_9STRE|nr:FadR/GntR family transcriptional regulator [Streptococcus merionis]SNU86622.1 GntR family transcriptional regulator [Streptococcus merionis]
MKKANQPLADRTADLLVDYIVKFQLEPGDRLPNEYELATSLEVGRSTIREAVRRLVARNILEVRQGSGTYVSSRRGVADDPLGFSFIKDTYQLTQDLFEIRLLLEPRVAAKAAQNATDEDCQRLLDLVERIEESYDLGTEDHVQLDVELHSLLTKMSGNLALDSLLPVIHQSISLINHNFSNQFMQEDSRAAHRAILEAVCDRDAVRAYDAMLRHILSVSSDFEKNQHGDSET